MSGPNYGLGTPAPRPPVETHELRRLRDQVQTKIRFANSRSIFSSSEVVDLLLDVDVMLDRLTSPSNLLAIAGDIAGEGKPWEQRLVDSVEL